MSVQGVMGLYMCVCGCATSEYAEVEVIRLRPNNPHPTHGGGSLRRWVEVGRLLNLDPYA